MTHTDWKESYIQTKKRLDAYEAIVDDLLKMHMAAPYIPDHVLVAIDLIRGTNYADMYGADNTRK